MQGTSRYCQSRSSNRYKRYR